MSLVIPKSGERWLIVYILLLISMIYIELSYCSWEREECYGMFDHSETKMIRSHPPIVVQGSGLLLRHPLNYDIVFCQNTNKKPKDMMEYETFLMIEEKDGHYLLVDNKIDNSEDQLYKVIPTSATGFRIKEKQKIRLGKINMEILNMFWKKRKVNHYEDIVKPVLASKRNVFTPSFYSNQDKVSIVESNPACRYCYSKTIEESNPFLSICNCSGYTKYIHRQCLVGWVQKRNSAQQTKEGVYCALAKAFTCELCNSFYQIDKVMKEVFELADDQLNEYLIVHITSQVPMIYVIDLAKIDEITIGRSQYSLIPINQLSVSRKHCKLHIEREKKQVRLIDLSAKFGTVVKVEKQEIKERGDFQKGRTKLQFKKIKKMSFFEKLGICSMQENLINEAKRVAT